MPQPWRPPAATPPVPVWMAIEGPRFCWQVHSVDWVDRDPIGPAPYVLTTDPKGIPEGEAKRIVAEFHRCSVDPRRLCDTATALPEYIHPGADVVALRRFATAAAHLIRTRGAEHLDENGQIQPTVDKDALSSAVNALAYLEKVAPGAQA